LATIALAQHAMDRVGLGHAALGALATGKGMERVGSIRAIVLSGTRSVLADR